MSGFADTATPISPDVQDVLHPGYDASTWYGTIVAGTPSSTVAIAADTIYFCPIQILRTSSWVSIGIRVGTAVGSVTGKLALYRSLGAPAGAKGLIAEGVGTVDMNSSSGTAVALNFASAVSLKPGWYWIASLFNGAAQPNAMNQAAISAHGLTPVLGAPTAGGVVGATSSLCYIRYTVSQPYASGFPAIVTSLTRSVNNPGSPLGGLLTAA